MRGSLMWFMAVMLISGAANTLLMKFMVMQEVPAGPGAPLTGFDHPFFQSLLMMIGEFLCLITYYASGQCEGAKTEEVPKRIFAVACLFDWTATTLVNMAYVCVAASVVQMTRGAVVIFTCLFSMVFLGRRQHVHHLAGVGLVFMGITMVSLSTFINPASATSDSSTSKVYVQLVGIALCVGAQVFQASMLVYEEKIMKQYTVPPLMVVGMEGFFGILFGVTLLCVLNVAGIESTPGAVYQMGHSAPLLLAVVASIFSIAFFNCSGVAVTQQASAVARSTVDVSRTILIWAVELAFGWNSFNFLQLGGFCVLALGTLVYNRLLVLPFLDATEELETAVILNKLPGDQKAAFWMLQPKQTEV